MKLVVFGLTVSSSWGNGHATLWRGLSEALREQGHQLVFFERDVPYYAQQRDLTELRGGRLHLYADWQSVLPLARRELEGADCGMVTSYCPDGVAATALLAEAGLPRTVFYDMDTPVTVERALAGEDVGYIGPRGLRDFDLVLSYTGGRALDALRDLFGARHTGTLYGWVDPAVHQPAEPQERFVSDLSHLGTWAANRHQALVELFVEPARRLPQKRFALAGAQYPADFPWVPNLYYLNHLPPADHGAFLCSSPLTLNVTRKPMAEMGYCPSGRLFESAACGVPVISDWWEGIDTFFEPGRELLVARRTEDVLAALELSRAELARIGRAAQERTFAEHTAAHRARELVAWIEGGNHVGHRSSSWHRQPDPTAGVQQGAAAGRQPA